MYGSNNLPSILQSISNANSAPETVANHTIRTGQCTLQGMELTTYISLRHDKSICCVSMYAMCCKWSQLDERYDVHGQ
jgi:hypothetical protein